MSRPFLFSLYPIKDMIERFFAHNLALTNVSQAIANADNHEYFAENTPALP